MTKIDNNDIKNELSNFGMSHPEIEEISEIISRTEDNTETLEDEKKLEEVNKKIQQKIFIKNINEITRLNRVKKNREEDGDKIMYRLVIDLTEEDIDFFCQKPRWSTQEAIALISGINPIGFCQEEMVLFLEEYKKRTDTDFIEFNRKFHLLNEDIKYKGITSELIDDNQHVIKPLDFIDWAKKRRFSIPEKVAKRVVQNNPEYIDWKNKYNEAQEEIDKLKNTQLLNCQCVDVNASTYENSKKEDFLLKKRANVYDKIIASLAILKFPVLSELNGSRIDSLTEKNRKKFKNYFTPLSRKTLTRYLENPRKLLQLKPTEQKNTFMNK